MACSFNHHPWHKAVKQIWITYCVTRKALGARQVNLSSRTRETDELSFGGMGEPSPYAAQYMCRLLLSTDWQPKGVWTHDGRHWPVIRKGTVFLCHVLHRISVFAAVATLALPSLLHPKQLNPTKQPVLSRGWPLSQVKHVRELGQSECVRSCLCSHFSVHYDPLDLHNSDWKCRGLGEIHGPV